jgi:hypothetical protein
LCKYNICNTDKAAIAKGNKKCNIKNLFKVGLSTENPPHNKITRLSPIIGIVPNKLVITVAPQRLI